MRSRMEMRERRAGLSRELGEAAMAALQGGGRLQSKESGELKRRKTMTIDRASL